MLSYFESYSAMAFLMDFFWASLFLAVGAFIRAKCKIFQNLFIPASVIAGMFGLVLGGEFLNIVGFSDQAGSYPGVLIIMLFATMLLGYREKQGEGVLRHLWGYRDTIWTMLMWNCFQFGLAMMIGWLLAKTLMPGMFEGIGLCMPGGFYGGYGYGSAIGGVFENYGLVENGVGVGCTFATVGMLVGIGLGMFNINYANRKGWLKFTKKLAEIPESERTGMIPAGNREPIGLATFNSGSIDPLGFHVALMFLVSGVAWLINYYIKSLFGIDIPALCLALLGGGALQSVLTKAGAGTYVDKKIMTRVGSTVTDYLVFFGFCTIRKAIFAQYWAPIVIFSLLGTTVNMIMMFWVCPRSFHDNWFERGIIFFGEFSGVMATGVTLLRIVDTENQSGGLEGAGIGSVPLSFFDLFAVGMYPIFCATGHTGLTGLIVTAAAILLFVVMRLTGSWYPDGRREGG